MDYWGVIIALEYQKNFYDFLPEKIAQVTADIFKELSVAVDKEVARAQGKLTEDVVEQTKKLSLKIHAQALIMWGTFVLVLLLLYGSLLLWAEYDIGSGQAHPPLLLLKMSVDTVVGAQSFLYGLFAAYWQRRISLKAIPNGISIFSYRLSVCCSEAGYSVLPYTSCSHIPVQVNRNKNERFRQSS